MHSLWINHLTSFFISSTFAIIWLVLRYRKTTQNLGYEVALVEIVRNFIYIISLFVFISSLRLISSDFNDGLLAINLFYGIYFAIYLIYLSTWKWRRQEAGITLLDVEQNLKSKIFFFLGLFSLVVVVIISVSFIQQISVNFSIYNSFESKQLLLLLIWCSIAVTFITSSFNTLEFTEKGICYRFFFIKWEKIKSYAWIKTRNSRLMIYCHPNFFLINRIWYLSIPVTQKNAVNDILAQYVLPLNNKC